MGAEVMRAFAEPLPTAQDYSQPYNLDRGLEVMAGLMRLYPEMPLEVAAGVAANSGVESYFNPAVAQGQGPDASGSVRGGGRGLFQWDGGRRNALLEQFPGEDWKSLENQLLFMAQENAGPEKSAWDKTMKQKSAKDAALTFSRLWERPGVPHIEKRAQLANALEKRARQYVEDLYAQNVKPFEVMGWDLADVIAGGGPMITEVQRDPELGRKYLQQQIAQSKARPMRIPMPEFRAIMRSNNDLAYNGE